MCYIWKWKWRYDDIIFRFFMNYFMFEYLPFFSRYLLNKGFAILHRYGLNCETSGKYHHFQVKFDVFKGLATVMRSHRNRKCSSTGKNGKGNCGKMLHLIEHLNVQCRGEIRCNREDPDTVYNNTTDGSWGLGITQLSAITITIHLLTFKMLNYLCKVFNNSNAQACIMMMSLVKTHGHENSATDLKMALSQSQRDVSEKWKHVKDDDIWWAKVSNKIIFLKQVNYRP